MIAFAQIALGHGGLAGCARCDGAHAEARARDLADVSRDLAATAASWVDGPGPNVSFVGFEPFLHPALPDAIGVAVSSGFHRVGLRTDAGALSLPGNAEGALAAGVRQIEVVVLAGSAEDHDRLSGRPGLFAASCEGVRLFIRAAEAIGAHVVVTGLVPLCAHNERFAPDAVAALARMGASAVLLDASDHAACSLAAVEAALDTATVNAMAGSATGVSGIPDVYSQTPWRVLEAS